MTRHRSSLANGPQPQSTTRRWSSSFPRRCTRAAGGAARGIPPHSKHAARVVPGLEAAAVSNRSMTIASLEPESDDRRIEMHVASPAALVVAKTYKLGERASSSPGRLLDKDAHDLYRLLNATNADEDAADMRLVLRDRVAGTVAARALDWLAELADTHEALIPTMAGRAEEIIGDPEDVAQRTWALIQELLEHVRGPSA